MRNAKGVSGKAVHRRREGGCLLVQSFFKGRWEQTFPPSSVASNDDHNTAKRFFFNECVGRRGVRGNSARGFFSPHQFLFLYKKREMC